MSKNNYEAIQQFKTWYEKWSDTDDVNPLNIIMLVTGKEFYLPSSQVRPVTFSNQERFNEAVKDGVKGAEDFFAKSCDSLEYLIKESVTGSTFRAFHLRAKGGRQPSVVYREYTNQLISEKLDDLKKIDNWDDYSNLVKVSANGLVEKFACEAKESGFLGFGSAAKLLNLSFKHVLKHSGFTEEERNRLIGFLHVPLDSYTLQGIRKLALEFKIPANASMGWEPLKNEETYLEIQKWIKNQCKNIGHLPIHYEIAAWNLSHPKLTVHSHES